MDSSSSPETDRIGSVVTKEFRERFSGVPLRLFVEALGGAYQPVRAESQVFVVGSLPIMPPSLSGERLTGIAFVVVAACDQPLASVKGATARSELTKHMQLVLTDRTSLSEGREFGVIMSSSTCSAPWPTRLAPPIPGPSMATGKMRLALPADPQFAAADVGGRGTGPLKVPNRAGRCQTC
jgi:hypothetical protein